MTRIDLRTLVLAALLAGGFAASAQAFTFEDKSGDASKGSAGANLSDPGYDRGTLPSDPSKKTIYQNGNFRMEMNGTAQPSNGQQFNSQRERMLNPGLRD